MNSAFLQMRQSNRLSPVPPSGKKVEQQATATKVVIVY
jgi:hypothetical protein